MFFIMISNEYWIQSFFSESGTQDGNLIVITFTKIKWTDHSIY